MTVDNIAPRRHRVVIVGSGFGGLFAAKHLKRADVDVTLIAKTTHHLFQPLLYQVATGILSVGEIAPATRIILRKQRNAEVLLGDVVGIDLKNKTVTSKLLDWERVTPFDSLIVAAGADTIVSVAAIKRFASRLPAGSHRLIEGARHEILQEQDGYRVQFWAAFDAFVLGASTSI